MGHFLAENFKKRGATGVLSDRCGVLAVILHKEPEIF